MCVKSIGIVGGGRIARILLQGWKRVGRQPSRVVVSDVEAGTLDRLKAEFPGISVAPNQNDQAAAQDVVLLALHPPAFGDGLASIRHSLRADAVLVSLAPKWTFARISHALGGFGRVARMIPNAPSIVGQGHNPISFAPDLPLDARRELLTLFEPWGASPEVDENTLEAYAIVAAMGPTYLWYQLYHLVDLAREFGLTRSAAESAVQAMIVGAAQTMACAGLEKQAVLNLVPVKPLAHIEKTVTEAYTSTLSDLHRKLKS